MARGHPALIAVAGFVILLGFFIAFRTMLIMIPIDTTDPFRKSAIGTLTALVLLVLQPFACHFAAKQMRLKRSATFWAFASGALSSVLLLLPALVLFME